MGYQTDWVDAFASEPLAGNGCAVVHDAGNLSDEICIKFVRETSLSECTFVEPSKKADVKVRYFLASGEKSKADLLVKPHRQICFLRIFL